MLLCTVRDCHEVLTRQDRQLVCPRGHSFDVARSGYINLLQPQDRRSLQAGDTAAAVAGRNRFHDLGFTTPFLEAIAGAIGVGSSDTVLDIGCGGGYYLANLAQKTGYRGCGVDLSVPAIDAAARHYPHCEWVVANADRFVPYANGSFAAVLSITARMNPGEFHRVLRKGGVLLIAVPGPDDLIELRGSGRDRVPRTLETFAEGFEPSGQQRVTTSVELDADTVRDVLHFIYRPLQPYPPQAMRVTLSLDLLTFRRTMP